MDSQLHFLASLDFPDGSILTLDNVASKLGCSVRHLLNEVENGALSHLDLKGKGATRRTVRVPVEFYRNYIFSKCSGPMDAKLSFILDLPTMTKIELVKLLNDNLRGRKCA